MVRGEHRDREISRLIASIHRNYPSTPSITFIQWTSRFRNRLSRHLFAEPDRRLANVHRSRSDRVHLGFAGLPAVVIQWESMVEYSISDDSEQFLVHLRHVLDDEQSIVVSRGIEWNPQRGEELFWATLEFLLFWHQVRLVKFYVLACNCLLLLLRLLVMVIKTLHVGNSLWHWIEEEARRTLFFTESDWKVPVKCHSWEEKLFWSVAGVDGQGREDCSTELRGKWSVLKTATLSWKPARRRVVDMHQVHRTKRRRFSLEFLSSMNSWLQ